MTLQEIRALVMFQTNNDVDDLAEFEPAVDNYINEAYDKTIVAYDKKHIGDEGYTVLSQTNDVPNIPEWAHRSLADYATYMVYRNGNALKQNRGIPYLQMFNEMLNQLRFAKNAGNRHFYNLYK